MEHERYEQVVKPMIARMLEEIERAGLTMAEAEEIPEILGLAISAGNIHQRETLRFRGLSRQELTHSSGEEYVCNGFDYG